MHTGEGRARPVCTSSEKDQRAKRARAEGGRVRARERCDGGQGAVTDAPTDQGGGKVRAEAGALRDLCVQQAEIDSACSICTSPKRTSARHTQAVFERSVQLCQSLSINLPMLSSTGAQQARFQTKSSHHVQQCRGFWAEEARSPYALCSCRQHLCLLDRCCCFGQRLQRHGSLVVEAQVWPAGRKRVLQHRGWAEGAGVQRSGPRSQKCWAGQWKPHTAVAAAAPVAAAAAAA